jgi:predicted NBD/HSP70 family sugar kinase
MRTAQSVAKANEVPMQSRGTTQSGVRLYNERLVLSLIRTHGQLPKAEIARLTGLSPQTVSVIVRQLESDQLVLKGKSVRGKVGQPLQPFSLNPQGAFSVGLKVGRRSGDLMLLGLDGRVIRTVHQPYLFPTPREFLDFAARGFHELTSTLPVNQRSRISGLGVATPFDIYKWEEEIQAPTNVIRAWQDVNLNDAISAISPWPVVSCNDASAACAAELFFGLGQRHSSFAYIYVGYFIGGGVVIDGHLHQGPAGNAGAIGSLPVVFDRGRPEQLIRGASFYLLEKQLRADGIDPSLIWYAAEDWSPAAVQVAAWTRRAAVGIALACASLVATLDCPVVIIDGAMPAAVRSALVHAVRSELKQVNLDGISPFDVLPGTIGFDARALGAASLPLFANFMIDRNVLFKDQQ